MKNFLIGGVPEHFNFPWYLTFKNKEYAAQGINLRWKDFEGGTGSMCQALRATEIDMAVILTEGIVRDIANGNPSKIIQVFVKTPLIWGIHVAANSEYLVPDDLRGTEAAISKFGSGSHLMAFINAENKGWDTEKDLQFKEIKNLEGAIEGLPKGEGDYFMWEKFMTKPYVDDGTFRLIDTCPTPWPSFVIAVRDDILAEFPNEIKNIISIINNTTENFKNIPNISQMIAQHYGQKLEDVIHWLSLTDWSQKNLTTSEIHDIQNQLFELDLIKNKLLPEKLMYNF